MELRLTESEERLLLQLLEDQHKHLLHEIAKAHHHDFKVALRDRCTTLEGILGKLGQPIHSAA